MSRILIWGAGRAQELDLDAFCADHLNAPFSWVHMDGTDDLRAIIDRVADIPSAALNALIAVETRPRCTLFGDGALVNLRGLGRDGEEGEISGDPLVSIRIWAQKGRVVSLSYRPLGIIDDVLARMQAGELADPGDVIAALAVDITEHLDPEVADLGDMLDTIESHLDEHGPVSTRTRVSRIRASAIAYRRFIAPQRQAMERLMAAQTSWLQPDDRVHLQEAADRCARMAEELEAVRERAALAHEGLTDLRAEHMNRQGLILAIVALIFLPLTFLTGLLGMNVEGIPYAHEPWAFWGVVGFCAAVAGCMGAWFLVTNWLQK
jgi:zinc transporter